MHARHLPIALLALVLACSGNTPRLSIDIGDVPLFSPTATPESRPLSFVVVGDFGVGGPTQGRVARRMQAWAASNHVDAVITTGDNIYPDGHPSSFANAWHRPYGWLDRSTIPIVASLGNHDVRTDGGRPVMRLFGMPARWYEQRFGDVQILVLDGNDPENPRQLTFIKEKADPDARWTIAVFHQPMWSCAHHRSTGSLLRLWLPLFRAAGVDLLLSGHEHSYQRFNTQPPAIVTGGGGASLYGIGNCPRGTPKPDASLVDYHFVVLDVDRNEMRVRVVDTTGAVEDDAVIATGRSS